MRVVDSKPGKWRAGFAGGGFVRLNLLLLLLRVAFRLTFGWALPGFNTLFAHALCCRRSGNSSVTVVVKPAVLIWARIENDGMTNEMMVFSWGLDSLFLDLAFRFGKDWHG